MTVRSSGRLKPPPRGGDGRVEPVELRVDVSDAVGTTQRLHTAAWLFVPSVPAVSAVVYAFPGGGYSKSYFHLTVPGFAGYSMAEFMVGRGFAFVACDNLATGGSSMPIPTSEMTWQHMVAANQSTVSTVSDLLARGELVAGLSVAARTPTIGLGHSFGGGLVAVQQARHRSFDAVAILGRSVRGGPVPALPEDGGEAPVWKQRALQHADVMATSEEVHPGVIRQRGMTDWQRFLYYDDVPPSVIAADERNATTLPLAVAQQLGAPDGPNVRAAGVIDVPLFLGFGERDVTDDAHAEVAAYRGARDIQLTVLPRSAHCHNVANSRALLWERLASWIDTMRARRPADAADRQEWDPR